MEPVEEGRMTAALDLDVFGDALQFVVDEGHLSCQKT